MDQAEIDYIKDKIMYDGLRLEIGKLLSSACFEFSHASENYCSQFIDRIGIGKALLEKAERLYEELLKIPPFAGKEPKE